MSIGGSMRNTRQFAKRAYPFSKLPCIIVSFDINMVSPGRETYGYSKPGGHLGGDYSSSRNIGSVGGRRIGFCFSMARSFAGTNFLLTTRRNMYSSNQLSVMMR